MVDFGKLGFVRALLKLLEEYGPLAKDLLPIIQGYIKDLNTSGMSTDEIIKDTGIRADRLIEKLEGGDLGRDDNPVEK